MKNEKTFDFRLTYIVQDHTSDDSKFVLSAIEAIFDRHPNKREVLGLAQEAITYSFTNDGMCEIRIWMRENYEMERPVVELYRRR